MRGVRDRRPLHTRRDEDGIRHAAVHRSDVISANLLVVAAGVMEAADDGGVIAGEDAADAAISSTVEPGRGHGDQHGIALHGAIELVRRDKDVICTRCGAIFGADEAKTVAVKVEFASDQVFGRGQGPEFPVGFPTLGICGFGRRDGPVVAVWLDQFTGSGKARQLFKEQAAFASAPEAQFAHKLLVTRALAGGAIDPA